MPLPVSPPAIFRATPEFVVECTIETIKAVAQLAPPVLGGAPVCMSVYVCVCLCLCLNLCLCLCLVCVCDCVSVCLPVCFSLSVCVYVCIYVQCVCLSVCQCVWRREKLAPMFYVYIYTLYIYIYIYNAETLGRQTLDDFVAFLMAYASAPQYIKNPYLRGKLLEAMSFLIPKGRGQLMCC